MSTTIEGLLDLSKEEFKAEFGPILVEIRKETGLSQRRFLKLLGVDDDLTESTLANWENGKYEPSLWFAMRLFHCPELVPVFERRPELRNILVGLYLRGVA